MAEPPPHTSPTTSSVLGNWRAVRASTSSVEENFYRYVDTQIGAVRSEMKGEIASVMATIREAEAQRSVDFAALSASLDGVKGNLPTKGTIWKVAGSFFGGLLALLALAWAIFDTGAAITGSFADNILEDKTQQDQIEQKLDKLIKDQNRNGAAAPTSN